MTTLSFEPRRTAILVACGIAIGLMAVALVHFGNPANMGICVACFLRDAVGALRLQSAPPVQYLRPEILGIGLGAFAMALSRREFAAASGSAPLMRLALGFFMMVGCLVFLGCPLRMVLRIAGGDANALVGFAGFACGIGVGVYFLKRGVSLPAAQSPKRAMEGVLFPLLLLLLLAAFFLGSGVFAQSAKGIAAKHAPAWLSLGAGLIAGAVVARTRLCFIGMVSQVLLFRQTAMFLGVAALTATVFAGNLALGLFHPGFAGQPAAHADGVWNFLSMALVGWVGVLLGGCPLRQLAGAGAGSADCALAVVGMALGAAAAHNFGLASSGAGPTLNGEIAVLAGFALVLAVSCKKHGFSAAA
jgi:YedE family putative selenium metabolism protein